MLLHLPAERLAALGDEIPTNDEATHLASCDACARERSAYQTLVSMAHAEREPFGLPLTRWDAIATDLSRNVGPVAARARSWQPALRMLQIAAALLLVAGGAMAGRASAGASVLSASTRVAQAPSDRQPSHSTTFSSADDARAAQQRSEVTYQQAAAFLAQFDSAGNSGSPVAYRSRLAALDRVISTTREAMRQAPHDPVINGYYLTTLGQREATLRQLNTSLPASMRVNSF